MQRWPRINPHFWETAPFFRLLMPLAAGIIVYHQFTPLPIPLIYVEVSCIFCFSAFAVLSFIRSGIQLLAICRLLMLSFSLFISGFLLYYFCDVRNDANWFGLCEKPYDRCLVKLISVPAEKEKSWKLKVEVGHLFNQQSSTIVHGEAFLYVAKNTQPCPFHKGDTVIVPNAWRPIQNRGNPFEFGYADYCALNNVYRQQYLAPNQVVLYGLRQPKAVPYLERAHDWCMDQLNEFIPDSSVKGLMQAMLIGDEVNLDEQIRQAYADTGIIHIIAISGGNVLIFFAFVSLLFFWLHHKKYLWIKYVAALPLVWLYIIMAGASPSAVRAAVMFSVLALGIFLEKRQNSLNQLLATAFVLLCAQPQWLFSVGFQLSFVAVLSLILFYRHISKWYRPPNKLLKGLWSTLAASIAAEVLTAPLVIHYFHLFPVGFLITNVAAYLFMSVVLFLGIAIEIASIVPPVAHLLGHITVWLVKLFHVIVFFFQRLTPVPFRSLQLSGIELLLVYGVIAGGALLFIHKNKKALFGSLISLGLLLWLLIADDYRALRQQKMVVYNAGTRTIVEYISGKTYSLVAGDSMVDDKLKYYTQPTNIAWHSWRRKLEPTREILLLGKESVLLLNHSGATPPPGGFSIDHVVVTNDSVAPAGLEHLAISRDVILAGNNVYEDGWKMFCDEHKVKLLMSKNAAEVLGN
jgi:competence protein ComEC